MAEESNGASIVAPTVKILTRKEKNKIAANFFREMYTQIYLHPPRSKKEYIGWVNVLSQGGSLEGVYRGLTLSREYRTLEAEGPKANLAASRFFVREVARLRLKENATDGNVDKLAGKLLQKIVGISIFTLKKELGDRMLTHYSDLESIQAKADWYGELSARWAAKGVDFGLEQRNKADAKYHSDWAKSSSVGFVQWEILNRVHRLLNHYGELKIEGKK